MVKGHFITLKDYSKLVESTKRNYQGEHGNIKPSCVVCGNKPIIGVSLPGNCSICGKVCYYDKNLNYGDIPKVCVSCALKSDEISAFEREILEKSAD